MRFYLIAAGVLVLSGCADASFEVATSALELPTSDSASEAVDSDGSIDSGLIADTAETAPANDTSAHDTATTKPDSGKPDVACTLNDPNVAWCGWSDAAGNSCTPGWKDSVPACDTSGLWVTGCSVWGTGSTCTAYSTVSKKQTCKCE